MDLDQLKQHLVGLEQMLHERVNRRDIELVSSLLSDDFREYAPSGRVWTKTEILDYLAHEPHMTIEADSYELMDVGEGVALLTYESRKTVSGVRTHVLRSSLWVRQKNANWCMLFHQATEIAAPGQDQAAG